MRWPGLLALALSAAVATAAPQGGKTDAKEEPPPPLPELMQAPDRRHAMLLPAVVEFLSGFVQMAVDWQVELFR